MKTPLLLIIILESSLMTLPIFAVSDLSPSSSAPENQLHYSYTNNELQSQFSIPIVVAIVIIITGIAVYAGMRPFRK
jgi:hypothetical protein